MSGFSNKDDFIYIKVQFTPGDESYVDDNDAVYMQRFIDVTYTIYGENSPTIALTLFSLLRTSDVEITVIFTSLTPSKVACHAYLPISRCLYTFSRTTIASSTKVPIIRERASNVIKLRV